MLAGISMGWMVAGIAAVALPLVAHLLSRRGGRTVVFPAMRFVMRAAAEHARRHRLRDLTLFLMRAAAVLLIALAFDRPVWVADASARSPGAEGLDVVIVLDASASMTRTERGRSLYEIARDRAVEVLAGLDAERDRAGVVFVRAGAEAALPRLSGNRAALIERVRGSAPTLERGDLSGALAMARDLPRALDTDPTAARERRILVIGDRQRSQWEGVEAPIGASVEFSPVGPEGPTSNLGVIDLVATPVRGVAGREITVTATVLNSGPGARAPRVTLREAGGRSLGAATPTIGPDSRATLTFSLVFEEPGVRRLEAVLTDESFRADDVARTVIEVVDGRRLALITGASASDLGSAAYFIEAALAPGSDSIYTVARFRPDEIGARTLDGFAAAIVVEAGAIPGVAAGALAGFAGAGGGVLWVVDSGASRDGLGAVSPGSDASASAEPGSLLGIPGGAAMDDLRFAGARPGAMEALLGPIETSLLGARFTTVAPTGVPPNAKVLARLDTGDPFILDTGVGAGRIISVQGALDPGRSTIVKSPAFPVLIGEVVGALADAGPDVGSPRVGEPITIGLSGGASGVLKDDRGNPARILSDAPGRVRVGVDPVNEPRFVEVVDGSGATLGCAGVGVDARESDMASTTDEEIAAMLSGEALAGTGSAGRAGSLVGQRQPIELWGWIMAGAALLLAVEGLAAASRTRERGATP